MIYRPFLYAVALALSACATVTHPPTAVEASVSQQTQIEAQKQAAIPQTKSYKRKVAIARFSNESNYGRSLMSALDYARIGTQSSDMLASQLVRSGRFIVLERPDLSALQKEQDLSGLQQKLPGVDSLIVGSVTEFGRAVRGTTGFLSKTKVQVARARVEARLVDVHTGHVFFSASGTGEADTETGEVAGFGKVASYDATLNDRAIAAAITDMIDQLVGALEERPWRTDVLRVDGSQVYISGGTHQGLHVGDTLELMRQGESVTSRQSGFDITLPPTHVATLEVAGLFGESELTEGALCTLIEGSLPEAYLERLYVTEAKP